MTTPPPLHITGGMSVSDALAVFREGCNHGPERLWITESWITPRFAQLRELLTDPITEAEAEALTETVLKRRRLDDVIEWLDHRPATWEEYRELVRRRATKSWKAARERGFFPWEDVEACRTGAPPDGEVPVELVLTAPTRDVAAAKARYERQAVACTTCGTPSGELAWIHFRSPLWTWQLLCGREGWLTVCDRCHLQVDFFMESMN